MINDVYFDSIGMVRDNISHTRSMLDSIEDDMQDIRNIMKRRMQVKVDREELIKLLEVENEQLKVSRIALPG
jgi:hypothetical protein